MDEMTYIREVDLILRGTRAFRAVTSDFFPNPDPHTSLLYALTELGEALSAWLRELRPGDVRKRDGDGVSAELCDTIMMIAGALKPGSNPVGWIVPGATTKQLAATMQLLATYAGLDDQDEKVAHFIAYNAACQSLRLLAQLQGDYMAQFYTDRIEHRIKMACERAGRNYEEVLEQWYSEWVIV